MLSEYNQYIIISLMLIVACVGTAKINFDNGRIDMCKEMNLFYTDEDQCMSCEDTGRIIKNGACVLPQNNYVTNLDEFQRLG